MRYYMGYVRNQRKMELALQKLRMVDEHVSRVMARNLHELVRTHETAHLLRYCELMVQASLAKKGVKGFYKRSDNVNRDRDDRFSPVVLWRSQGQSFTELQVVR
jgi:succinate dehydrogenase/fumarate reductase flavoprotein subunit